MSASPIAGRGLLRSRQVRAGALVTCVAIVVYLGSLGHGFPFDDTIQVLRNERIRRLAEIPSILTNPTWPGYVYRPLPTLTYALTHALFGLAPWAYHLTNVVLHGLVTLLVFVGLVRLFDLRLAFVAALLFAVHPVHVEAVASIANRTELLAALLGGVALLLLVARSGPAEARPGRTALRLIAAGASFFLALLAKESAIVLFLLLPLCLAARRRDGLRSRADVPRLSREAVVPLAVLGVATGLYFAVRQWVLGGTLLARDAISVVDNPLIELPGLERMARAWALLGRYVALVLLPMPLGADYSLGSSGLAADPFSPETLLFVVLATGLAVLTVVAFLRGERAIAFFGAWFFASFAVTSNLVFPIGTIFADRLAYVPSLGVLGLVALLLVRVPVPALRAALCTLLVGVLAARAIEYDALWRDSATLFRHEVATSPSGKAHCIYGEALSDAGALAASRAHFEEALRIYPLDAHAQFGLALLSIKEGRREEGVAWLDRALTSDPRHVPSLLLLGRLTLKEGRVDDAGRLFVRALNEENESFDAKLGILAATLARGNLEQAAALRAELSRRDPGHVELRLLGEDLDRRLAGSAVVGAAGCVESRVTSCGSRWREKS